jgi:hypothetical protein
MIDKISIHPWSPSQLVFRSVTGIEKLIKSEKRGEETEKRSYRQMKRKKYTSRMKPVFRNHRKTNLKVVGGGKGIKSLKENIKKGKVGMGVQEETQTRHFTQSLLNRERRVPKQYQEIIIVLASKPKAEMEGPNKKMRREGEVEDVEMTNVNMEVDARQSTEEELRFVARMDEEVPLNKEFLEDVLLAGKSEREVMLEATMEADKLEPDASLAEKNEFIETLAASMMAKQVEARKRLDEGLVRPVDLEEKVKEKGKEKEKVRDKVEERKEKGEEGKKDKERGSKRTNVPNEEIEGNKENGGASPATSKRSRETEKGDDESNRAESSKHGEAKRRGRELEKARERRGFIDRSARRSDRRYSSSSRSEGDSEAKSGSESESRSESRSSESGISEHKRLKRKEKGKLQGKE